ncbi:transcriptional regulator [Herbaspirillum lusitanum]|uniref:transcriptional regulator n=1 Tax=Herbaspirillum lusitanum TaxID=213312 RepID=UPI002237C44E|nr:transcriptional regulator [Herbaspirillum lusitanum]MCW5297756.1 transcriptional regulator [Herbaspirillum lusitanum]
MPTNDEKVAFSKRLELALRRSPDAVEGATELALQFSLRHSGAAVSTQTAHKWLSGRAIPTNEKLVTLAKWLNVEEHWLHYGSPPVKADEASKKRTGKAGDALPSPDAIKLAEKIQALPPHRRYLLEELVSQLKDQI